jgi:uncharacterized protein YjbI with pentapeptide repeats/peptidoglycan hydrolase-like protein with peptidoglycan-binding domain
LAIQPSDRLLGGDPPLNLKAARLNRAVLRFAALSKVDLEHAELLGIDLAHAKLDHTNLRCADISVASLDHVDFSAANLSSANLSGSRLRHARLSSATLQSANISLTDLSYAKLDCADLTDANLGNALLHYTDFSGATLRRTNLRGANLYHAKNLTPAQLDESIGAECTILPPYLQGAVKWSNGKESSGKNVLVWHDQSDLPAQRARQRLFTKPHLILTIAASIIVLLLANDLSQSWETSHRKIEGSKAITTRATATASQKSLTDKRMSSLEAKIALANSDLIASDSTVQGSKAILTWATATASQKSPIDKRMLPLAANIALADSGLIASATLSLAAERSLHPQAIWKVALTPLVSDKKDKKEDRALEAAEWHHPDRADFAAAALQGDVSDAIWREPFVLGTKALPDAAYPVDFGAIHVSTIPNFAWAMPKASNPVGSTAGFGKHREPLILAVSLSDQLLDVYRGASLLTTSKISSGKPGYATRTGVFSILEKKRFHHSNLYSNAPMPWMQRLTRSGTAFHAGILPGYPASHGCIRLPFSFAPKLFTMTEVGGNVVVANHKIKPVPIEHANLFQPNGIHAIALASNLAGAAHEEHAAAFMDVGYPLDPFSYGDAIGSATSLDPEESGAPLRILVTKQTERDRIIAVQNALAPMGYLEQQQFTGKLGKATVAAIMAFQKANGMRQTGIFTDDLAKRVYTTANLQAPPAGRLFVRQEFQKVFDAPLEIIDPDKPLGTHVFVATQGNGTELQWVALSVEGDEPANALDRLVISPPIRNAIEQKLRFGSALIVSDVAIDSAILPQGDDFLVLGRNSGITKIQKVKPVAFVKSVPKVKKATHTASKRRRHTTKTFSARRPYSFSRGFGRGFFSRW